MQVLRAITLNRRQHASSTLQRCCRARAARCVLSTRRRLLASVVIQSAVRNLRARRVFLRSCVEYVEREQCRAQKQIAVAWKGCRQRKLYLAGLMGVWAGSRRMSANAVMRNWSSHLVRAVMKFAGRNALKALVVAKVLPCVDRETLVC
jgi:hypothetical protein